MIIDVSIVVIVIITYNIFYIDLVSVVCACVCVYEGDRVSLGKKESC